MMKVAVFLDYANINASSRQRNFNVDYGALLDYLATEDEGRTLQVAYAYVPINPRQEHAMDATINEFWQKGYIVKSKVGTIAGDSYKCDFDVEMTLDISRIAYVNAPDVVVIVSGDSDFIPIVLDLRERGIRVDVAAFEFAMSHQLALKSSGFINLDALEESDFAEESQEGFEPIDDDNINQSFDEVERDWEEDFSRQTDETTNDNIR